MAITVKRNQGFVDFCADLSLRAEWETAVQELDNARKNPSGQMVDTAASEASAKVQELEAQMAESIHVFQIAAIQRRRWNDLGLEHEPRDGVAQDARLGVNTETYFDAVAMEPGCIIAVTLKTDGSVVDFDPKVDWVPLADEMTNGQYNDFVEKFLELNRNGTNVPFSKLASIVTRASEQNSSKPSD